MRHFRSILVFGVRVYRWTLSPLKIFVFGPNSRCRFQPSCSEYAIDALESHGVVLGSWLSVKRVCRCHPWGGCGYDPVPHSSGPTELSVTRQPAGIKTAWAPDLRTSASPNRAFGNR